jgi:hypothetical protein
VTEQDWLTNEDPDFLARNLRWTLAPFFPMPAVLNRKFRLVAAACCRLVWHRLTDQRSRAAVEQAERCLAGPDDEAARVAVAARSFDAAVKFRYLPDRPRPDPEQLAAQAAFALVAWGSHDGDSAASAGFAALPKGSAALACRLLRCQFGNPFQPLALVPAGLTWNGGVVRALAEQIDADGTFEHLPILADALDDAGCSEARILDHCRDAGPHARGCWVVDLLQGRTLRP